MTKKAAHYRVKPKKRLGQNFLIDQEIAQKIVSLAAEETRTTVEIGPGTGALTNFLLQIKGIDLWAIEIDREAFLFLKTHYPKLQDRIIEGDALKLNWRIFKKEITIIGNFPYSISAQLFFKILAHHDQVKTIVCMLQKEVAMRIVAAKGNKTYGILSVLLQAYYNIEFLFEVPPTAFFPRPNVTSAVIRLKRNDIKHLNCDEQRFRQVVKQGFQNRRKTLRNALKKLNLPATPITAKLLDSRAEQLAVNDFVSLAQQLEKQDGKTR